MFTLSPIRRMVDDGSVAVLRGNTSSICSPEALGPAHSGRSFLRAAVDEVQQPKTAWRDSEDNQEEEREISALVFLRRLRTLKILAVSARTVTKSVWVIGKASASAPVARIRPVLSAPTSSRIQSSSPTLSGRFLRSLKTANRSLYGIHPFNAISDAGMPTNRRRLQKIYRIFAHLLLSLLPSYCGLPECAGVLRRLKSGTGLSKLTPYILSLSSAECSSRCLPKPPCYPTLSTSLPNPLQTVCLMRRALRTKQDILRVVNTAGHRHSDLSTVYRQGRSSG